MNFTGEAWMSIYNFRLFFNLLCGKNIVSVYLSARKNLIKYKWIKPTELLWILKLWNKIWWYGISRTVFKSIFIQCQTNVYVVVGIRFQSRFSINIKTFVFHKGIKARKMKNAFTTDVFKTNPTWTMTEHVDTSAK